MQRRAAEPRVSRRTSVTLEEAGRLRQENETLRDRLFKLSESSLRISRSLEPYAVLQGVIDSACSLTSARYGALLSPMPPEAWGTSSRPA